MSPADSSPKISIDITQADNDGQLVMKISAGSKCNFHPISLAQARALSLELIKQVYRAEMKNRLSKAQPKQSVSIPYKHRQQA